MFLQSSIEKKNRNDKIVLISGVLLIIFLFVSAFFTTIDQWTSYAIISVLIFFLVNFIFRIGHSAVLQIRALMLGFLIVFLFIYYLITLII